MEVTAPEALAPMLKPLILVPQADIPPTYTGKREKMLHLNEQRSDKPDGAIPFRLRNGSQSDQLSFTTDPKDTKTGKILTPPDVRDIQNPQDTWVLQQKLNEQGEPVLEIMKNGTSYGLFTPAQLKEGKIILDEQLAVTHFNPETQTIEVFRDIPPEEPDIIPILYPPRTTPVPDRHPIPPIITVGTPLPGNGILPQNGFGNGHIQDTDRGRPWTDIVPPFPPPETPLQPELPPQESLQQQLTDEIIFIYAPALRDLRDQFPEAVKKAGKELQKKARGAIRWLGLIPPGLFLLLQGEAAPTPPFPPPMPEHPTIPFASGRQTMRPLQFSVNQPPPSEVPPLPSSTPLRPETQPEPRPPIEREGENLRDKPPLELPTITGKTIEVGKGKYVDHFAQELLTEGDVTRLLEKNGYKEGTEDYTHKWDELTSVVRTWIGAINNLEDPHIIFEGQKLVMPSEKVIGFIWDEVNQRDQEIRWISFPETNRPLTEEKWQAALEEQGKLKAKFEKNQAGKGETDTTPTDIKVVTQ